MLVSKVNYVIVLKILFSSFLPPSQKQYRALLHQYKLPYDLLQPNEYICVFFIGGFKSYEEFLAGHVLVP